VNVKSTEKKTFIVELLLSLSLERKRLPEPCDFSHLVKSKCQQNCYVWMWHNSCMIFFFFFFYYKTRTWFQCILYVLVNTRNEKKNIFNWSAKAHLYNTSWPLDPIW